MKQPEDIKAFKVDGTMVTFVTTPSDQIQIGADFVANRIRQRREFDELFGVKRRTPKPVYNARDYPL